jgi:hypothetical protein
VKGTAVLAERLRTIAGKADKRPTLGELRRAVAKIPERFDDAELDLEWVYPADYSLVVKWDDEPAELPTTRVR